MLVSYHKRYDITFVKSRTFLHHLQTFARDFTGNRDVKVVFGGNPRTDGETIWLNNENVRNLELADFVRLVESDNLHECGHILWTNFMEHRKRIASKPRNLQSIYAHFFNIVEDAYLEFMISHEFKAFYPEIVWSNNLISEIELTGNKLSQYQQLCLAYAVLKREYSSLCKDREVLDRYFVACGIIDGIYVPHATDDHRHNIAEQLIDLVNDWVKEWSEDDSKQLDFANVRPDTQNGVSDSNINVFVLMPSSEPGHESKFKIKANVPNNGSLSDDDNELEELNGEVIVQEAGEDSNESAEGSAKERFEQMAKDFTDEKADNEKVVEQVDSFNKSFNHALSSSGFVVNIVVSNAPSSSHMDYVSLKSKNTTIVNNLVREFKSLESEDPVYITNQYSGSKLDTHLLFKQQPNKMKRKRVRSDPYDPAILLLADLSGSTAKALAHKVYNDAFVIFNEFCNEAKIPLAIFGHNVGSRNRLIKMQALKLFEDKSYHSEQLLQYEPGDNTREDVSLVWGANYLSRQSRPNKLMICLSDGFPYHGYSGFEGESAKEEIRKAESYIESLNIDMIGLGLGIDLRGLYKHSLYVENFDTLPKVMLKFMREKIRGW